MRSNLIFFFSSKLYQKMRSIKKKKEREKKPQTTINKPTRVSVDDESKIGISVSNVRQ